MDNRDKCYEFIVKESDLVCFDKIQQVVLEIYGKYDLNKSIIWMVEELGEFVSAIRKKRTKCEIESEMGDLLAWVLCISNILDIDVSAALTSTFRKEIHRQFDECGSLKYATPHYQEKSKT